MLQSDWLSYTISISVQSLSVVQEMRYFYSFSAVLKEILGVNGS